MTQQTIFYKSLKGLSKQNFRLSKPKELGTACNYLSVNGDKCAVGVLLTTEELHQVQLEGANSKDVVDMFGQLKITRFREIDLLVELQNWHDGYLTLDGGLTEEAVKSLKYLATSYLLKIPKYIRKNN